MFLFQYGTLAPAFTPVIDGDVLTGDPATLRKNGQFMKVKIIAGLNKEEGAYIASKILSSIKSIFYFAFVGFK